MRRETRTMMAKEMMFYKLGRYDHYKDSIRVMARKIDNFNFDLDGVTDFEVESIGCMDGTGLVAFKFNFYGRLMKVEVYKYSFFITKNSYADDLVPFVVIELVQKIRKLF